MRSFITAFLIIGVAYMLLQGFIIIRHDTDDSKYVELGKKYQSICHFPMGEGVLIDSEWVLTAGHVGNDLKQDLHDGYKPKATMEARDYEISTVIVHPGFHPIDDDIALVKLKKPVAGIVPASLYRQRDETGKMITIVGLGDTGDGITGPTHWDKIIRGATNLVDGADAEWIWFDFDSPASSGTTELEGISGPGDSGGPAFINDHGVNYVAGISSHQDDENGKKGTYGVVEYYTRVSSYFNWIEEIISKN